MTRLYRFTFSFQVKNSGGNKLGGSEKDHRFSTGRASLSENK